jgi:hypothetical protein
MAIGVGSNNLNLSEEDLLALEIKSGNVNKESTLSGDVINDYINELSLDDNDDITISDINEETDFFDEGIIPQSWYDYFQNPEVETPIEGLPNDIEISDLNENQPFINKDHFINNLIPFQEGDFSNTLMTDYIFPGIDKSYDAISNIGTEDLKDAGMDLLRMIPNTAVNIPETYRDILTLPFQGARDIAQGDYTGAAMNPLLAADPSNSLLNYSDNPVSSTIGKAGEYIGGLYGAKKIQDAIMKAKNTPNWLKSFFRQGYPHFTRSSAKNLESILPSFKNFKKRAFGNTLSALRGAGQYGLASGIFSLPLAATAYALTPSQSADHDEAGLNWERSQDPNKYNFSALDFERENMNRMTSRDNMRRNFEIANTRTTDQGPGPRDNYRGL